jgi:lysophospholipase L1-like esterase
MTYTKQTWADTPATTTPLSAARLGHMEDGIAEGLPQQAARTFTLPYGNGGLGGTVATSLSSATAGSDRFVVKLPETCTQWRLKIRNWEFAQTSKTAATLKKLVVGKHARSTTGTNAETGSFVGSAATTIVSTDQTIPGTSGTWYTSPWVTAAGDVFEGGTEFLVGFGWTISPSTVVQTGAGRSWHWTDSTSGTTPATAGSGASLTYVPFDIVLEITMTNTRRKVCLVIGDSISEGILGTNAAVQATPLWRGPFHLWAARKNRLIVNLSLAGIQLVNIAGTPATNYIWTRQDLTAYPIDEVILSGGSNDFSPGGRSLAQMQADTLTIVNYLATLGISAPIYMATILARGTTNDAVRLTYNEWIASLPTFATGVVDFDGALRGTSATNLVAQYTPDDIHPSWLGAHAMADKLCDAIP